MSKLFMKSIIQYGGEPSESEKIVVLNTISKSINKKMKNLEYNYKIKLKLSELPVDNWDCLPKNVGFQTFAQIDGPIKGRVPIYTKTSLNIPTPTISTVTAGVPITSFGPVIGVPAISINPFGNSNNLNDRINIASKYLDIISKITNQLEELKTGSIKKSDVDTQYFEFVDLDVNEDEFEKFKQKYIWKEGYSNL